MKASRAKTLPPWLFVVAKAEFFLFIIPQERNAL